MLGFFNINKPTGATSTQMVSIIKRATGQKCGHLGTLDPMASGVLPIAVGKATKLFDWFLNKDKRYFAIGLFGVQTDTLDAEGKIKYKEEISVTKQQIDNIIYKFQGEIDQIPPKYSSVCINGRKAYDLARDGKEFQLPTRKVNIYDLQCVYQVDKNLFAFDIHCSAGTYVRSLILAIAQELGTVATTVCIIRKSSGAFNIKDAHTIEEIASSEAKLIEVHEVVDLPKLTVNQEMANKLLNGQTLKNTIEDGEYLCYAEKLLGIAKVQSGKIKLEINMWENAND